MYSGLQYNLFLFLPLLPSLPLQPPNLRPPMALSSLFSKKSKYEQNAIVTSAPIDIYSTDLGDGMAKFASQKKKQQNVLRKSVKNNYPQPQLHQQPAPPELNNSKSVAHRPEAAMNPRPELSDESQNINGTTYMDDSHYNSFAQREVAKLRVMGRMPNPPPSASSIRQPFSSCPPPPSSCDDHIVSESSNNEAVYTRGERQLVSALSTINSTHPGAVDESKLTSGSPDDRIVALQALSFYISSPDCRKKWTNNSFPAFLTIISTFVSDKSDKVSFLSLQAFKTLLKCYKKSSSSAIVRVQPPKESENESEFLAGTNSVPSSDEALLTVIPLLLKRLSSRHTPKEMQQLTCKGLLALSRCADLNGLRLVIPFLGSEKFSIKTRLFVLKLLTKEFGLGPTALPLNCSMVMSVATSALKEKEEKVKRAATSLIVVASGAAGKEKVYKYFRTKKLSDDMISMLTRKINEAEEEERTKKTRRRMNERSGSDDDQNEGEEGERQGDVFDDDFLNHTTYSDGKDKLNTLLADYSDHSDEEVHPYLASSPTKLPLDSKMSSARLSSLNIPLASPNTTDFKAQLLTAPHGSYGVGGNVNALELDPIEETLMEAIFNETKKKR